MRESSAWDTGVDDKNLKRETKFRLAEKAEWQTIHEGGYFDEPDFIPLGYGRSAHSLCRLGP